MHALYASLFSLLALLPAGPGWLGIYLAMDTDKAVVAEVIPDTPAAKAGLQSGDVLLAVGDTETATRDALIEAIREHEAGKVVAIKLRRGKKEMAIEVELGNRPEQAGVGSAEPAPASKPKRPAAPSIDVAPRKPVRVEAPKARNGGKGYLGISVREVDGGLLIERVLPDGPCAKAGIESGYKIVSLGDRLVGSLSVLDRTMRSVQPGQKLHVGLQGEDGNKSVTVVVGSRPGAGRSAMPAPSREIETIEVLEAPDVKVEVPKRIRAETEEVVPVEVVVEEPVVEVAPEEPARAADAPPKPRRARSTGSAEKELMRELKELRRELRDLRRMIERLKRSERRRN